jgi:hypothetical protein
MFPLVAFLQVVQEKSNELIDAAGIYFNAQALNCLAGVEGFEPPNGGIKTRCLTTWRHPKTSITNW